MRPVLEHADTTVDNADTTVEERRFQRRVRRPFHAGFSRRGRLPRWQYEFLDAR